MSFEEYGYRIVLESGARLVAEGIKRVVEFSADLIVLQIKKDMFEVVGNKLSIDEIFDNCIIIKGEINAFSKRQ